MKHAGREILRILGEMEAEWKLLTGMSIVLCLIESVVYLMQINRNMYAICLLDAFALVSYTGGITLIPGGVLAGVFVLREEFHANRLIRMKSMAHIWLGSCIKVLAVSFCSAAVCTLWCGILGKMTAVAVNTWDTSSSLYYAITMQTANVSYEKVCLMFFMGIFFSIWASSMVTMLTYWIFNSFLWGMIIITGLCAIGTFYHLPYDFYRGANYFICTEPIYWKYQVIWPLGVTCFCIVMGLLVHQKDFLLKEGRKA